MLCQFIYYPREAFLVCVFFFHFLGAGGGAGVASKGCSDGCVISSSFIFL